MLTEAWLATIDTPNHLFLHENILIFKLFLIQLLKI